MSTTSFKRNGVDLPIFSDHDTGADPINRARQEAGNQRDRIGSTPLERRGGTPGYVPGYGQSAPQNRPSGFTPQAEWNQQFGHVLPPQPTAAPSATNNVSTAVSPQGNDGSASLPLYSDSTAWMGHEGVSNPPPVTVESNVLEQPSPYNINGMRTERSADSGENVQAFNPNHDLMNDQYQNKDALAIAGNGASRAFFVPQKYGGGVGSASFVPDGRNNATPPNPIQRPANTTDKKPGITPVVDYSVSGRLNPYV